MLSDEKISKLKELLNNSQNPLFLFDNDTDGLCSFLLLNLIADVRIPHYGQGG